MEASVIQLIRLKLVQLERLFQTSTLALQCCTNLAKFLVWAAWSIVRLTHQIPTVPLLVSLHFICRLSLEIVVSVWVVMMEERSGTGQLDTVYPLATS